MPLLQSDYVPPSWAKGGHLQTILPAKLSHKPRVAYRREHIDTPDGDFLLFDWAEPSPEAQDAPVLIHFHGLEGSSESHYARSLMAEAANRGWRGVVACYRTCGGELNRLPRAYFAGDTEDCSWVIRKVHEKFPLAPVYLAGMSLGGNYISKFLGDSGESVPSWIRGAAAVGAPLDMFAGYRVLSRPSCRIYEKMFLGTLIEKTRRKIQVFGDFIDVKKFRQIRRLWEFDAVYTAPVHGFKSKEDYWARCGAIGVLHNVRAPLLLLNPLNDPFQPPEALPKEKDVSGSVFLEQPAEGGHIGFPAGKWPGNLSYLPERIFRFFETECGAVRKIL